MQNDPMHILLIEDEESDAVLFSVALEIAEAKASLHVAEDARRAMAYLNQSTRAADNPPVPDLIVLDLWMPQVTGLEFLRWLRSSPEFRNLPVALFTGMPLTSKDVQLAYGLAVNRIFLKPAGLAELAQVVREMCDFAAASKDSQQAQHLRAA